MKTVIDTEQWMASERGKVASLGLRQIAVLPSLDDSQIAPGGKLGVGMECLDRGLWDWRPSLAGLQALGVKQVRLQSGWCRTEQVRGVYDFAWLDEVVDALLEKGVTPWLSLSYGNPLYAIPGEDSRTDGIGMFPLHSEEGTAAWLAYVRETVRHFNGRIKVYEIWNEPDVSVFLPCRDGNWIDDYMRMVETTVPVIRLAQPDALVASCTATKFDGVAKLMELGLGKLVDIHSFHAYTVIPERHGRQVADTLYAMMRRDNPKLQIWRGEAGMASYFDLEHGSRGALYNTPASEEIQARFIGRHVLRDLGDAGLDFTSYFHLYDFEHMSRKYHYYYGVLRENDYSRKPSFYVLQRCKHLCDDGRVMLAQHAFMEFNSCEACSDEDAANVEIIAFKRNDLPLFAYCHRSTIVKERPLALVPAIVWCDAAPRHWQRPVVVDIYGGAVYEAQWNPKSPARFVLPLGNRPFILTEAAALEPYCHLASADRLDVQEEHTQTDHE